MPAGRTVEPTICNWLLDVVGEDVERVCRAKCLITRVRSEFLTLLWTHTTNHHTAKQQTTHSLLTFLFQVAWLCFGVLRLVVVDVCSPLGRDTLQRPA